MHRTRLVEGLAILAVLLVGIVAAAAPVAVAQLPRAHPGVAAAAESYLDYPYLAGGTSPEGFSTPGFVTFCFTQEGLINLSPLGASTAALRRSGPPIARRQLRRGDLVFFRGDGDRAVVAVSVGDNAVVYASREAGCVVYDLIHWRRVTRLVRADRMALPEPQNAVVAIAQRYIGVPYVWGGASPSGFDCSGLTMYCYAQVGITLPHSATAQQRLSLPIPLSALQPGDLVFFGSAGYSYHVGIYVGSGVMIHAPHTGAVVSYGPISGAWIAGRF
jgi:cell wall-associated NlpC family hydrolase